MWKEKKKKKRERETGTGERKKGGEKEEEKKGYAFSSSSKNAILFLLHPGEILCSLITLKSWLNDLFVFSVLFGHPIAC
jgi:hypothetical protein